MTGGLHNTPSSVFAAATRPWLPLTAVSASTTDFERTPVTFGSNWRPKRRPTPVIIGRERDEERGNRTKGAVDDGTARLSPPSNSAMYDDSNIEAATRSEFVLVSTLCRDISKILPKLYDTSYETFDETLTVPPRVNSEIVVCATSVCSPLIQTVFARVFSHCGGRPQTDGCSRGLRGVSTGLRSLRRPSPSCPFRAPSVRRFASPALFNVEHGTTRVRLQIGIC